MVRPNLLLHPKKFEKQSEDLSMDDLEAAWRLLMGLTSGRDRVVGKKVEDESEGEDETREHEEEFLVFYNCGAEAGASQGHKHLQIITRPREEFVLFPDEVELSLGMSFFRPRSKLWCIDTY